MKRSCFTDGSGNTNGTSVFVHEDNVSYGISSWLNSASLFDAALAIMLDDTLPCVAHQIAMFKLFVRS